MSEEKSKEEIVQDIAKSLVTWILEGNKDLIKEAYTSVVVDGHTIDQAITELSRKLKERVDEEEL